MLTLLPKIGLPLLLLLVNCALVVCGNAPTNQVEDEACLLQVPGKEHEVFASYLAKHGRTYSHGSPEYGQRLALFQKRVAEMQFHNSQPGQVWTKVINHLSDRTDEELAQLRGWKGFASARSIGQVASHQTGLSLEQVKQTVVPANFTWEHLQSIKADQNQGGCGSCWAVATVTMMNAADEIAGNKRSFSTQDLVNCVPNPHNCGGGGGCTGATVELAMNWIAENGLRTKAESPYTGSTDKCTAVSLLEKDEDDKDIGYSASLENMIAIGQHDLKAHSMGSKLGLKHWTRLPENEYHPLLVNLIQNGPLAISVDANDWSGYGSGIFNSCNEDAVVDHAVVLFGYGFDPEYRLKFWDIKNSWGNSWGRNGNIRILREDTIKCGIDSQPEAGTGCEGGPKQVKVCGACGILYDVVSVTM